VTTDTALESVGRRARVVALRRLSGDFEFLFACSRGDGIDEFGQGLDDAHGVKASTAATQVPSTSESAGSPKRLSCSRRVRLGILGLAASPLLAL
jgi:hypothetical protein